MYLGVVVFYRKSILITVYVINTKVHCIMMKSLYPVIIVKGFNPYHKELYIVPITALQHTFVIIILITCVVPYCRSDLMITLVINQQIELRIILLSLITPAMRL